MALIELNVAADIAVQLRRIADALDRAVPQIAIRTGEHLKMNLITVDPEAIALAEEQDREREERGLKPGETITREPE